MVHFRYIGMVTSDDKKRFTIGRKLDTVRTMFSPAIHHFERNNGIQLVISIGVKKSIQSTLYSKLIFFGIMSGMIVHHDIEAVKSPQQTLCMSHIHISSEERRVGNECKERRRAGNEDK